MTNKGIQMVLNHLPALRELDHSVVEVLAQISQTVLDNKLAIAPQFSLTILRIMFNTPYISGSLGAAAFLCPWVTKVRISNTDGNVTDKDLQGLLVLERLEDLNIHGYRDTNLTFFGGIVPLLRNRGSSLKKLELSKILVVDITTIVEYCINLRSLKLFRIDNCNTDSIVPDEIEIPPQPKRIKIAMPKLNNLEILYLSEFLEILPDNLFLLLSSPTLKVIEIVKCDTLTDDLLQRVANLHSFRKLEKFIISDCYWVTGKIMNVLLVQENNLLKRINMDWINGSIATNIEKIAEGWVKEKIRRNWDLKIECKNWDLDEEDDL